MKSISAAIITIGGLLSLVVSGFIDHADTQLFVGFVSFFVMAVGIITWLWILRGDCRSTWADGRAAATSETNHG